MKSFPIGGVHPSENKLSREQAIEVLALPDTVTVLLSQHIGAPAVAKVAKGDKVLTGQLIAEAGGFVSSNIHSPISGTVTSVDLVVNGAGLRQPAITIKREGDEWAEGIDLSKEVVCECKLEPKEIIAIFPEVLYPLKTKPRNTNSSQNGPSTAINENVIKKGTSKMSPVISNTTLSTNNMDIAFNSDVSGINKNA